MNPLDKIKKRSAIKVLPDELQMLLKFSRWIDYDLYTTGNLESKLEYQNLNNWLYKHVRDFYGIHTNVAEPFKNRESFIDFGFEMARVFDKRSLREMEDCDTYYLKVINNKITMFRDETK